MANGIANQRFHGAGVVDYDERMPRRVPGYDLLHLLTAAQAVERLPEQAHVLVVGAGTGHEVLRLANLCPGWRFTATDVSGDMLALAHQKFLDAGIAHRVRIHLGGLDSLPPGPPHDAALLILVAHFVPAGGKQPLLDGIAVCLRPGALLLTADLMAEADAWERPAHKRATMLLGLTDEAADAVLRGFREDFHPLDEPGLRAWLEASGFSAPTAYFRSLGFGAFASTYGGAASLAPAPHGTNDGGT